MSGDALVFWSPAYECDIGPHVFPTEKYGRVRGKLLAEGVLGAGEIAEPAPADRATLARVHTAEYLDDLEQLRWTARTRVSELPLDEPIVSAYRLAAGATVQAAEAALARGVGVNLGGGFHHAFADHAEGFCYLNDLAVAARTVRSSGRARRVAIVDLDVHQGNGTAHIFAGEPDFFTLSLHQEANYPVPKQRSRLDVGLADGTGDRDYLARLDEALAQVWAFAPELVLYQAGADPFEDDQLGGLALTRAGLEARDRRVLEGCAARGIAAVITLGGGYARRLEDTVAIHATTCRVALECRREERP